ncbi:RNA polymerase sigma-70 factor [Ktedonosporobacter rubrisoli]|uniref:RNA polymerase sigma-70 factor n=1 Tax=Ktedonosporobacter rubrisoli TaxID=2509675 RepID=A0A4P6JN76_KTERU|nr:RNA polymerase sigma-70 factor [Ktedonosporobacter rubrisoli]QBD76749.1 RNA polymerase sigma-70 factor [Ktedonosporobacter rubrisoli]
MHEETIFQQYKPLLFSIAYNMLGTVMDAEDCVQEAFLRWHKACVMDEQGAIRSPKAYLSAIVTNICIDQLRLAKHKHEEYIGVWLPEPVVAANDHVEMAETLSLAFVRLLTNLSPIERAVFLLRQAFDYDYDEIARIVGKSEGNCRQIVHRAQQHLASQRPQQPIPREQHRKLMEEFVQAAVSGNMEGLLKLLAEDIVMYADGGGKVRATLCPVYGRDKVLRGLLGFSSKAPAGLTWRISQVNGRPGMLFTLHEAVFAVLTLEIVDGRVQEIDIIRNPDKLQHIELSAG